jgi:phage-related protein
MQEYLELELQFFQSMIAEMDAPVLEFERFVFTDTGTLLMTWTDPSGRVEAIRQQCRGKFPGALNIKQPAILHTSLLRLLSGKPLDDYIRQKIVSTCEKWSAKCRGSQWQPNCAWYVIEKEFSTLEGHKVSIPWRS